MMAGFLSRHFTGRSDGELLAPAYRGRLLFILLLVCTLNFVDRAVLSAVVEPIKQELGLTDLQVGLLQGLSFALLYSLLGVPVGRLAERYSRLVIISASVAFFSIMTLLCGFASTFLVLFFCRVGVGVGEAGFMSPTSSLVSDHYPATKRASALSIIMLGSPLGYLIGAMVGGWIAQHYGWRTAFIAMGVPGLVLSVIVLFVLIEPVRGLSDGTPATRDAPPPMTEAFRILFAKPAYRHVLIAGALCTFGMTAIGQFSFLFYLRSHGLSLSQAGMAAGMTAAVSLSIGTLLGGFGVDWGNKYDRRWNAWTPAIGVLIGSAFYCAGFLSQNLFMSITGVTLGGLSLFLYYTPTYAMAQNMAHPRMRATAVAIYAMVFGLIGAGLGPTFLGLASDRFAHSNFKAGDFSALCPGGKAAIGASSDLALACQQASANGLRFALASVTIAFVWAAVHFLLASRTLVRDLYVVEPGQ
jgi:predicted MFS family arabinose efflux permease